MKRKTFFVTIFILLIFANTTALAALTDQPHIKSPAAILMDANTGQILYEKNIDEQFYPASITKIMTAMILLEEGDLDKVVEIGEDVPSLIEPGSSQIYLIAGEKLTRKQLLYSLLVDSANDAAVAIAQDVSGSVENFAKRMNEKAEELGATNTHFVNPHGLHNDAHYVTAKDMAMIAKGAMKNPIFRDAVSTVRYIIPKTNKQDTRYLYNGNRLIKETTYKNYYYEDAIGIKTGYTTVAKNTLVGGAHRNNLDLITVVLNANGTEVYEDTHELLDYGFANYTTQTAVKEGEVVDEITLENTKDSLPLLADKPLEFSALKNDTAEIDSSIEIHEDLSLPIKKSEVVGNIHFSLNGQEIGTVPLIAGKNMKASNPIISFVSNIHVGKLIIGILVLFLLYRAFVYTKKKRRSKKRKSIFSKRKYRI